jgi:hypothetical protein
MSSVPGVVKYEGCPVPDTDKDGIFDDKINVLKYLVILR